MDEQKQSSMQSNNSSIPSRSYENGNVSFQSSEELISVKHQNKLFKEENEQMMSELANLRQRNLSLEEERVNMTSAFNKENMEKMTEIARLQSQVEKGEAARQVLEYDFAVVKKKSSDTIRATADKENLLAQENKALSAQKSVLEGKIEDMEKALQIARRVTTEDEKRIAFLVDEKKQVESEKLASEAVLRSHHDKLAEEKAACMEKIKGLSAKIKDMERSLIKQDEELKRKLTDLQVIGEREQHMHSDLNELSHRCRALEESVEAERAAHLESKFNAEIIQLKQQETETGLDNEKELNCRLKQELQTASKRSEDLVKEASAAIENLDAANQKMEKSMKICTDLRKQLDEEIKEKNRVVKDLTSKISKYQESIEQTKEELNATKKKLIHIEEGYSSNMREVELLIETYSSIKNNVNKQATSKKKDKAFSFEPRAIIGNLKQSFLEFRRTVDDLQRNLEESKSTESQIQKDCNNFRDLALTREKSLQTAQQDIMNCGLELNEIRVQQSDYELESKRLHRDLEEVTKELEEQTNRCKQLEENANSLMDRHRNENEAHIAFLRELHHVLGNHAGRITSSRFTWSEFTVAVREGVDSLMNSLSREKEKSLQHETSCFQLEKTVGELQREHEASVDRLARQCREREEDALRQRKQLEEHYNALINELQGRAQKSQGLCDEAWERIRAGDGISEALHAECAQLRGENSNILQERKALASACALLFGALYPTLRSRDELAKQRALLIRSNEDSAVFKNQLRILVETLSEELQKPGEKNFSSSSFKKIHPLIRFRVSAIAVLAANRLHNLARNSNATMFSCSESSASANRVLVVAGKSSNLIPSRGESPIESHSDNALIWLSDQRIVHLVRDSMCGLVDAIDKNSGTSKGYMSRAIVKTAKNSFLNILRQTHPMFSSVVVQNSSVVRERSSLVCLLSEGLARVIHKCRLTEVMKLQSVDHSLSVLQRHLLNFTERLHATEVEKRNLRNNESKLKAHIKQLTEHKSELDAVNEEIKSLRDRENLLVSKKRFDGVCTELNAALEREQQAQKLLHEQNAKLQELSAKLDEQCTEGEEKENTLTQAVNSLSDAKMELKRCTQSKRILSKQVSKLEQEKANLGNKVSDAKEALKKAAREKDSLASYFQTVEKTMKKMPEDAVKFMIDLPKELSETKAGPDVVAAQRAVESFVHAQSSALSRISGLEEQISDYRSHINALKRELQDAFLRDNGYVPISEVSHIPTHDMTPRSSHGKGGYITDSSMPCDADFMPLKGVAADESSYSLNPYSKRQ